MLRNPLVQTSCAKYLGSFEAESTNGQISKGTQWLVWRFESDSTLTDALDGRLGAFPDTLEQLLFGKVDESQPRDKREAAVSVRVCVGGGGAG